MFRSQQVGKSVSQASKTNKLRIVARPSCPLERSSVRGKLPTWTVILLLFAISLSPRLPFGQLPRGRMIDVRLEDLLLLVLVPLWVARSRVSAARRRFSVPIAVYVGIAIMSTSAGATVGWVSGMEATFYLLKEVEYFLIFLLVCDCVMSRRQIRLLMGVFLILGLADCGWKLAQLMLGLPLRAYGPDSLFQPYGGVQAGAAAVFPLAIAAGWFAEGSPRAKAISILLMGAFSISLLITLKRSFIGAALAGLALLGVVSFLRLRSWRYTATSLVGLGIMAVGYAVAVRGFDLSSKGRLSDPQLQIEATVERVQIWRESLEQAFFQNPILGIGKGSFPTSGATHNFYVRLLADVGIVGALAFVFVWLSVGRAVINLYRFSPDGLFRWVAVSWFLATGFIAVANVFGEYLLTVRPAEMYWFLSGVAAGTACLASRKVNSARRPAGRGIVSPR